MAWWFSRAAQSFRRERGSLSKSFQQMIRWLSPSRISPNRASIYPTITRSIMAITSVVNRNDENGLRGYVLFPHFLALLDSREASRSQASQFSRDPEVQIVTTEWVLAEFGNAYSDPRDRGDFVNLYRILAGHPRFKIIARTSLFQSGIELFAERRDKEWSLVDCIPFLVMQKEGLSEALTGDHHFEQAGFTVLFG